MSDIDQCSVAQFRAVRELRRLVEYRLGQKKLVWSDRRLCISAIM
jgi:hypothetical protein